MKKLILKISVGATCALAFGAITASAASASATAYTVGSGTAVPAGESTGLALDALGNQVFTTEQFGAEVIFTATGVECANCMIENTTVGGEMQAVGTGEITYTGMTTNIPGCQVGAGGKPTKHETKIRVKIGSYWIFKWIELEFVTIHVESAPGKTCPFAGTTFDVEGAEMTGNLSGDVLSVESEEGLTVNEEPATLTGEMTVTAGVTGGSYHPLEFK